MSFQAPYSITDMRRLDMAEAQQKQQMQQQYQEQIMGALGDLAGMYQQSEQMKAGVKSGEQLLKMFGPQLGVDSKILSSPEYKAMGLQGQSALHSNLWGSLGAISQLRMAGMRNATQQNQPFVNAGLDDMANTAAGNQTITPGANDPANTVPLPEADTPLPAVQGAPGASPSVPGGRASWDARNRDRVKRGLQPLPYPPGLE